MSCCDLCEKFNGPLKPDSSLKKCINSKCEKSWFHATPLEMIQYYLIFIRKTLFLEHHRVTLSKRFSSRFSRDNTYNISWEIFIDEVVNNKDNLDISRVGVYYSKGIGVKKSGFMADLFFALAERFRSSPTLSLVYFFNEGGGEILAGEGVCPVCTANPDNGADAVICEICTNMICNFCYKRLLTKKCPTCNEPYCINTKTKIRRLREAIKRRHGRNIENAKVFLAQLILLDSEESDYQAYTLSSGAIMRGCKKGYYVLGSLYLQGKGCIQNIPTAIRILETGVRKGQADCMIELGRLHTVGIGVKKSKSRGIDFYKMAALNGSSNALIYLSKLKR